MMRRKAFTLIELLVVIAIIAILMTILLPSLNRARDLAKRATCLANLNAMGKAIPLYMAENEDRTPVISASTKYGATGSKGSYTKLPGATTETDERYEADGWSSLGDHPMQNMWLMIQAGQIETDNFKCGADTNYRSREDKGAQDDFGWVSPFNFSYGMHIPTDGAATDNKARFNSNLEGGVVVMADQMPDDGADYHVVSKTATPPKVPINHVGLGTCFLTMTGSAGTTDLTNSECGANGDDIYANQTAQGGTSTVGGIPAAEDDSSICVSGRLGLDPD